MALYAYKKEKNSRRKKIIYKISTISILIGATLLFWALYPVISFELYSKLFINQDFSSPIPFSTIKTKLSNIENSILGINTSENENTDLTQASLWFPTVHQNKKDQNKIFIKEYYLSIPKLNITNAKVKVGGEDLSKSLIHYFPSSLPGEKGNVVIFGHSTLPQLYDKKDYKTIFTYLSSLSNNDIVKIQVRDEIYTYKVNEIFVIKPDKTSVLDKIPDESYITLITCVPPGTYWNRLVVRAKLSNSSIDY